MLRSLSFLWPFLRRYPAKLSFGMAAILASVAVGLLNPLLIGHTIDALRAGVSRGRLFGFAALVLAIALVQGVFSYLQRMILVVDEPRRRARPAQPLLRAPRGAAAVVLPRAPARAT